MKPHAKAPCKKCGSVFEKPWGTFRYCETCRRIKCLECGTEFTPVGFSRKPRYCSMACRSKHRFRGRRVAVACTGCGKMLSRPLNKIASGRRQFCGYKCRATYLWADTDTRSKIVRALKASPKVLAHRMSQRFPSKMTGIERALAAAFESKGWRVKMHVAMFGRFQPDFQFQDVKLIVQADGDYWHSKPEAKKKDAKFDALAVEDGWLVVRLLASRVTKRLGECVEEVERAMHRAPPRTDSPVS